MTIKTSKSVKKNIFIPKTKMLIKEWVNNYYSMIKNLDCVLGNSSSGLLEVPSYKIATINIGDRQNGRIIAIAIIQG